MSSSLEEKLREIKIHRLNRHNADRITEYLTLVDETIEEIIQAFKDEGWVTPENAKKVQSMVNQMANLANDAFRMPTTIHLAVSKDQKTAQRLMTGQEWHDRFLQELIGGKVPNGRIMVWNSASSVSLYEAPRLHQHEYVENSSLPYRDLDQKEFIQKNYSCKCGAGKYERVPV